MGTAGGRRAIRLLHLSDIHFRERTAWDADPLLRALTVFISEEVERDGAPDLVAITGDLAFSGTEAEYDLARKWLDALWGKFGNLPRDRLLLVPGNHDVDRKKVGTGVRSMQGGLLSARSQDDIAALLADGDERGIILKRHAAYLKFLCGWLDAEQDVPWWERSIPVGDTTVHVAGLDSAWMACGDEDRGRLLLGRWQLNQTVRSPAADGADWRIALLHHPWDYLAEFDHHEARAGIHQHRDLLLRGHLHFPQTERTLPPDPRRACLELAAGCVYENSRYPNAFQWIELEPEKRVRVQFRAWIQGAWTADRNQPGCQEGEATFNLAAESKRRDGGGRRRSTTPGAPDLRKYLDDLWVETASIDIRGLASGPARPSFPIDDLYIELGASGSTGENALGRKSQPERRETPLAAELKNHRLVIIGDPGCGKTTFLRWVAHCLACDRLGRTTDAARTRLGLDRARLPVLVSVAAWLDYIEICERQNTGSKLKNGAGWLPEYLGARAADAAQGIAAAAFQKMLAAGDCLVLLDGLDEAPDQQRRRRAVAIIESVATAYRDSPLVVTSRPAAYQDKAVLSGFARTEVDALEPAAIEGFLACWTRALNPDRPDQAERERRELAAALASRPEIRRMARNAVMLTALAVVHWNEKRLPEQRAELYDAILKWLLESREQRPGREKPQRCRLHLAELALAMQADGQGRRVQVARRWAAERLAARFGTDVEATDRAEAFLAEEEIDSGIIVRRGHELKFWHLTFQEYLAAQALAGKRDTERADMLLEGSGETSPALYRPEWRETVLLLAGVLCLQGEDKVDGLNAAILDQLGEKPTRAEQARTAGLLGAFVRDLQPFGYRPADSRYAALLRAAMAVFDSKQAPTIPVQDRVAAADALALFGGDPRLGWDAPNRWVELPGGEFLMGVQKTDPRGAGYDPDAFDSETPVHRVILDPFRIARFPVTVTEYAAFVDCEDFADPRWWQAGGGDEGPRPDGWDEQQTYPSRPVVGVSWYQAMAFCAWITAHLAPPRGAGGEFLFPAGCQVRLPTEAEWECAVRGSDGRRYPWGNQRPDAERANFDETNVGGPSPVGIFPAGATPDGVVDLAGNVWEWCLDAYDERFYAGCAKKGTAHNPVAAGNTAMPRVLRGGSCDDASGNLRATFRGWFQPEVRDWYFGFRCVLAPPRQP